MPLLPAFAERSHHLRAEVGVLEVEIAWRDKEALIEAAMQRAVRQFAPQFASAGIVPVMGAGSVSEDKQPEPLEPGSAVSAILVRGDMDIAATCTVTYIDPERLLACGHPLLQFGIGAGERRLRLSAFGSSRLQGIGHLVKGVGQGADFIVGGGHYPDIIVPGGNRLCTLG